LPSQQERRAAETAISNRGVVLRM